MCKVNRAPTAAILGVSLAVSAVLAHAQTSDAARGRAEVAATTATEAVDRVAFHIPNQPLGKALAEWSRQSGLQVLRRDVAGGVELIAPAVNGSFSPAEALEKILMNSGLQFEFINDRTVRIAPVPVGSAGGLHKTALRLAQPTEAATAPPVAAAPGNADALDEIQVTASRIQRSGFEAPTPTTMLSAEQIEERGAARISDVLFELPAMRPTSTAAAYSASAGASFANLRNLSPGSPNLTATRTLVLIDGRRVAPNTNSGLVDLNSLPTSLIERIEIVTGGASAAWGSDAVAGVANFILKKKIEGFDASAQYGMSGYGDFDEKKISLAWGTGYAGGRGQIMLAGEYSDLGDIPRWGDRPWGSHRYGWVSGVVDGRNVTRIAMPGVTSSNNTAGGVIVASNGAPLPTTGPTSALRGIQFGPGGSVLPFVYGSNLSTNLMVGGSGSILTTEGRISGPVDRLNGYGRTTFAFSDNLDGFLELGYAEAKAVIGSQMPYTPNGDPLLAIQRDNAFLPASIGSIMDANGLAMFHMGRYLPEFGDYVDAASRSAVTRFAAGLNGKLGADWRWNAYVGSGSTDYYDKLLNNTNERNFRAALDSVIGPDGTPICRIDSTNPADIAIVSAANYQGRGAAPGCVAANPFGPGSISSAVADYVVGVSWAEATMKQQTAGASIQGEPFSTWAGPVSIAGGVDYRRDSVNQTADAVAQTLTPAFQVGGWQFANRKPLKGSYDVKELFSETIIPIAKDLPGLRSLDLNAAVRFTDYSTSGNVTSWKTGLSYEPGGGLRLRATRSRDIRAANLVELYTQGVSTVITVVDYGRPGNPSVAVPVTAVGNINLKPEEADTTAIGLTWQPAYIPGLQASVDYYKIDLKDAVGALGGPSVLAGCYGRQQFSAPRPELCMLITRDSSGVITNVANQSLNFAALKTSGVDLELGYAFDANRILSSATGRMNLRLLGTYVDEFKENNGIVTVDRASQIGNARWRLTGAVGYTAGPLSLHLQARYIDATRIDVTYGPNDIYDNSVPSSIYVNGSGQYTLFDDARGQLQMFVNINNLFDKAPPVVPAANAHSYPTVQTADYDRIGRYFIVGARVKF